MADVEAVLARTSTVHVIGSISSGEASGALGLDVVQGHGRGGGTFTIGGGTLQVVLDQSVLYIKGDEAALQGTITPSLLHQLANRWLRTSPTGQMSVLANLVNLTRSIANFKSNSDVTKGPVTTLDGSPVIELTASGPTPGRMYVALSGPPRIVEIKGIGSNVGLLQFDQYGTAALPSVPPGPVVSI